MTKVTNPGFTVDASQNPPVRKPHGPRMVNVWVGKECKQAVVRPGESIQVVLHDPDHPALAATHAEGYLVYDAAEAREASAAMRYQVNANAVAGDALLLQDARFLPPVAG